MAFKALFPTKVELVNLKTPFEFIKATPPLMAKLFSKVQFEHSITEEN